MNRFGKDKAMRTINAIYENGVFKPAEAIALAAGTTVHVLLPESIEEKMERLRTRYPNSFGVLTPEAADELTRIVDEDRGRIEPDLQDCLAAYEANPKAGSSWEEVKARLREKESAR
jgi:predicted DNA-binding antitoxin AbrB/MazE fold protein